MVTARTTRTLYHCEHCLLLYYQSPYLMSTHAQQNLYASKHIVFSLLRRFLLRSVCLTYHRRHQLSSRHPNGRKWTHLRYHQPSDSSRPFSDSRSLFIRSSNHRCSSPRSTASYVHDTEQARYLVCWCLDELWFSRRRIHCWDDGSPVHRRRCENAV